MKEKEVCKKYNDCSAPLCPIQKMSIKEGIWYPDEDICGARNKQTIDWIKKQKLIVKAAGCNDKYFTVEMIKSAKQIRKGVEGIDPDQPLAKAYESEQSWIKDKKKGRVVANEDKKPSRVVAKKKAKSSSGRKTITSIGKSLGSWRQQ